MDEIDKEALTRAIELSKAEPERAEQIESMLKDRSWEEVAQFAAKHQQCKNLQLKPGEIPPCHGAVNLAAPGTDADQSFSSANRLLQRLLDAGLSQWEPDPEAALAPPATQGERGSSQNKCRNQHRGTCIEQRHEPQPVGFTTNPGNRFVENALIQYVEAAAWLVGICAYGIR